MSKYRRKKLHTEETEPISILEKRQIQNKLRFRPHNKVFESEDDIEFVRKRKAPKATRLYSRYH